MKSKIVINDTVNVGTFVIFAEDSEDDPEDGSLLLYAAIGAGIALAVMVGLMYIGRK